MGVSPEMSQDVPRLAKGTFGVDHPRLLGDQPEEPIEPAGHLEAAEDPFAPERTEALDEVIAEDGAELLHGHGVVGALRDPARAVE